MTALIASCWSEMEFTLESQVYRPRWWSGDKYGSVHSVPGISQDYKYQSAQGGTYPAPCVTISTWNLQGKKPIKVQPIQCVQFVTPPEITLCHWLFFLGNVPYLGVTFGAHKSRITSSVLLLRPLPRKKYARPIHKIEPGSILWMSRCVFFFQEIP